MKTRGQRGRGAGGMSQNRDRKWGGGGGLW